MRSCVTEMSFSPNSAFILSYLLLTHIKLSRRCIKPARHTYSKACLSMDGRPFCPTPSSLYVLYNSLEIVYRLGEWGYCTTFIFLSHLCVLLAVAFVDSCLLVTECVCLCVCLCYRTSKWCLYLHMAVRARVCVLVCGRMIGVHKMGENSRPEVINNSPNSCHQKPSLNLECIVPGELCGGHPDSYFPPNVPCPWTSFSRCWYEALKLVGISSSEVGIRFWSWDWVMKLVLLESGSEYWSKETDSRLWSW